MAIEYRQPKMKDSLYGEMLWEDDSEYEWYWFSNIEDETYGKFQVLIVAATPADFMATRNTHSTYKKLLAEMPRIQSETALFLMQNEEIGFAKKKHKKFAVEKIVNTFEIAWITIYQDLSSKIVFSSEMLEYEDEFVFSYIGTDGEIEDAEIGYP